MKRSVPTRPVVLAEATERWLADLLPQGADAAGKVKVGAHHSFDCVPVHGWLLTDLHLVFSAKTPGMRATGSVQEARAGISISPSADAPVRLGTAGFSLTRSPDFSANIQEFQNEK